MRIRLSAILLSLFCLITTLWLVIFKSGRNLEASPAPVQTDSQKKLDSCPPFDPRFKVKDLFPWYFEISQKSNWIAHQSRYSISYDELHSLLYGADAKNIYSGWPNYHGKFFDGSYPHTSLTRAAFKAIAGQVKVPLHFIVEVGSFIGKSATNIGRVLRTNPEWADQTILLCIDTWLGGLEHWTVMRSLSPLEYGRPMIYEQFLANVIAANLTKTILPLSMPSLIGAQFLLHHKLFPQMIYLDSAHLQGETLIELELYWFVLQPGGILVGDDWKWRSVQCDVLRFVAGLDVNVVFVENTWLIRKPLESS